MIDAIAKKLSETKSTLAKVDEEISEQLKCMNKSIDESRLSELRVSVEDAVADAVFHNSGNKKVIELRDALSQEEARISELKGALEQEQDAAKTLVNGLKRRRLALLDEIKQLENEKTQAIAKEIGECATDAAREYQEATDNLVKALARVIAIEEVAKRRACCNVHVLMPWGWGQFMLPLLSMYYGGHKNPGSLAAINIAPKIEKMKTELCRKYSC